MATGGKDRQSREQRERARIYQARQELHRRQGQRRRRDNVLGLVVGIVVIAGAIAAQTAYFVAGPGAPASAPTVTDSPSPSVVPDAPLLDPEQTTAPTP